MKRASFLSLVPRVDGPNPQESGSIEMDTEVLADAILIEAWRGKNAYSNFIRKNRRRPSSDEAKSIGMIMGAQVKAADGSLQPQASKVHRDRVRRMRTIHRQRALELTQIDAVLVATKNLVQASARIETLPPTAFQYASAHLSREEVHAAISLLIRFAESSDPHEEVEGIGN